MPQKLEIAALNRESDSKKRKNSDRGQEFLAILDKKDSCLLASHKEKKASVVKTEELTTAAFLPPALFSEFDNL